MTIAKNDKFGIPHYTLLDKPNNESNVSMLDLTTWVIIAEHVEYSRHGVHMIQGLIHEISRIPISGANCEASLGDHKNCWMLTLPVSRDAIRGLGEKKMGPTGIHFSTFQATRLGNTGDMNRNKSDVLCLENGYDSLTNPHKTMKNAGDQQTQRAFSQLKVWYTQPMMNQPKGE